MSAGIPASSLALYISAPVAALCIVVIAVLCYVCCSKRYRLNWYDRTLLDGLRSSGGGRQKVDTERDFLQTPATAKSSQSSLENSVTTFGSVKPRLPIINLGHVNASVVTKKIQAHRHFHDSSDSNSNSSSGGGGGGGAGDPAPPMGSNASHAHHDSGAICSARAGGVAYKHGYHGDSLNSAAAAAAAAAGFHYQTAAHAAAKSAAALSRGSCGEKRVGLKANMRTGSNASGGSGFGSASASAGGAGGGGLINGHNFSSRRGSTSMPPVIHGGRKGSISPSSGSGGGGGAGADARRESAEFWVPPTVLQKKRRAQSLVPTLGLLPGANPKAVSPETSTDTSPHMSSSQPEMQFSYSQDRQPLVDNAAAAVPTPGRGRRRASMQDALDPALIDAQFYQKIVGTSIEEEENSTLTLSLTYDAIEALLYVKLIQVTGLRADPVTNSCDPYCKLRLLPNKRQTAQSQKHCKTCNPQFNEEYKFTLQSKHITEKTLQVLVYTFHEYQRDECLGQVLVPLDSVDMTSEAMLERTLGPYDNALEVEDYGDVMLQLSYLPSAERLTLIIVAARNLFLASESNSKNLPNPFVKVSLFDKKKRLKQRRSETQSKTSDPQWNQAMPFDVTKPMLNEISLEVVVCSETVLGKKEKLGKVVLGARVHGTDTAAGGADQERKHWQELLTVRTPIARWHKLQACDT